MKSVKSVVLGVFCCLCLNAAVSAGIIHDNLGAASDGADDVAGFGPFAASFTSSSSIESLTEVKLLLTNNGSAGTGSVVVSLLADSSTAPGASLTTIGTIDDSAVTSSLSVFDLTLASPFALAASTRYWIQVATSNGSTTRWSWSGDTSGTDVAGEYFANQNGVFDSTQGPYQMQVITGTASAAPEPSTLVGASLATIGALALRRRRRSA
jgi:hypothetical protein